MTDPRELARRVTILTAGLVAAIAAGSLSLGGVEHAVGALAGGAITIANFLWLHWTASVAVRRGRAPSDGRLRYALWLAASGARFGVVAVALGLAMTQSWLGLTGLLASLLALPVTIVAEGLRTARVA